MIEPEPWGAPYTPHPDEHEGGPAQRRGNWQSDERGLLMSAEPRNNIVIHPEDAHGLEHLPDWKTSYGCWAPPATEAFSVNIGGHPGRGTLTFAGGLVPVRG
ncbi:hypothetical protein ACGFRG_28600 [Streptomyces sp. NPDC048696]|uniref:hypothetical protein n=1 Tax=Streptomyces sp. NPDC048696 TaxID=3365585 RepID=UPI00371B72E5